MKSEKVLCINLSLLQRYFDLSLQYWKIDSAILNNIDYNYTERRYAEDNFSQKQVIPYALVFDRHDRIFCYQRHGSEARLAGRLSTGIGGHVNDNDHGVTLYNKLLAGLQREMQEEMGITFSSTQTTLLGMINEDESAVGRCHIGVVFRVRLDENQYPVPARELANPQWNLVEQLDPLKFELWSMLAIRLAETGR